MDYRNTLDDQNLIIYGHHYARDYDPSGSKQFSALDILLDEENYGDNKSLELILDNEIRRYEVAAVFVIDILDDDEIQVIRTDPKRDLSGNEDPLASRVAQGVSGPSSSCVWNPRVFADDARV